MNESILNLIYDTVTENPKNDPFIDMIYNNDVLQTPNPYDTKKNWIKSDSLSKMGIGFSLGSALGNFFTTRQAERDFYRVQEANRKAAIQNYLQQTRAINNRYSEEMEASARTAQETQIKNMQAKATAQASSASSGVSGNSLVDLYRDYDRATAVSKYVAARNLHLKGLQLGEEVQALRAKAINEINANSMSYSQNAWGNLLSGLGGTLQAYAQADYQRERLLKGI